LTERLIKHPNQNVVVGLRCLGTDGRNAIKNAKFGLSVVRKVPKPEFFIRNER